MSLYNKVIISIEDAVISSEAIRFICSDNTKYILGSSQYIDRKNSNVRIHRIDGNIEDLIGSPIENIIRITRCGKPTYISYKIKTMKGCVRILWVDPTGEDVEFFRYC